MISFTASKVHMSRSRLQARVFSVSLVACAALIATGCGSEGYLKAVDTSGQSDCGPDEIPYDGADNDCDPATPDDDLDGDGVGSTAMGGDDCDDADPAISGDEVPYDGLDNDCQPGTRDDDLDGDGHTSSATGGDDCNDANWNINPEAIEVCDGADNDCEGTTDGADATDAQTWYPDADHDTFGDADFPIEACTPPADYVRDQTDCDDVEAEVNPRATEVCNGYDDDCDGATDDVGCGGGYGGHRIDKDGDYYYALYNDKGFGILGSSDWFGSTDASSGPEGVTWNEDQTAFYYNDLGGNVWMQTEPFGNASTKVGNFGIGQSGGGVTLDGVYYVGDYYSGNIYGMDLYTGRVSLYASLGSTATKPYFGNNSMAIDADGTVYAASSAGIVAYTPTADATMLNSVSGLLSITAMDADNELYSLDNAGHVIHFDKSTGAVLGRITISTAPSTTWTMAVDANGDFVVNYWGQQRIFSHVDGSAVKTWDAASYYPGSSGYYWYVTF